MTTKFDKLLWSQPKWLHYGVAVALALAFLLFRQSLHGFLGDRSAFGLSLIPVAIAAYMGGFGPGMVCAVIGMTASTILFASPNYSFSFADPYVSVQLAIISAVSLFISLTAGRLRKSAFRNSRLVEQIDADRQQMDEVLTSVTDAFFCVDPEWNLIQFNPAFSELVRDTHGVALGRPLWEMFPAREATPVFQMLHRVMKHRVAEVLEAPRPGSEDWYQLRAFPTRFGLSVFIQDITERKMFDRRREKMLADERVARSASEEAGRMKEEFLAILSHELRTPMTSLLGWANLLNRETVSPERLKEGLLSIEASAKTQAKMVEELLDLSRINAGKLRIEMEFLTLSDLVEDAVRTHRPAAAAKNISVRVQDDSDGAMVRGDSGRLHQVFANLISNAIKFTPKGGHVEVCCYQEGSTMCFTVKDNGEGIAPEFLPHIFERFRQANSTYARRFGGLGLGLSIAKQLIELQGGTIEAKSDGVGKGSEFQVCIPVVPLKEQKLAMSSIGPSIFDLKGSRVLVVEDDPSTRMLLRRLIEEHNGLVRTAEDAQEGMDAIPLFRPNVILSDVGLPNMDGCAFMCMVRKREDRYKNVPSVALTAFARDEDRAMATDAGFNAFMTKPVNSSLLMKTLVDLALTPF